MVKLELMEIEAVTASHLSAFQLFWLIDVSEDKAFRPGKTFWVDTARALLEFNFSQTLLIGPLPKKAVERVN